MHGECLGIIVQRKDIESMVMVFRNYIPSKFQILKDERCEKFSTLTEISANMTKWRDQRKVNAKKGQE